MAEHTQRVKVRFTEQQLVLLEQIRAEGTYGRTMEEVIVALFRDYARQILGTRRR